MFTCSYSCNCITPYAHVGIIVGLILKYALPPSKAPLFDLACAERECNENRGFCDDISSFQIGEDIQLRASGAARCEGDENIVLAEVLGKVFKDENGNYIEQTVSVCTL